MSKEFFLFLLRKTYFCYHKCIHILIKTTYQIRALHVELLPYHRTADASIQSLAFDVQLLCLLSSIIAHHSGPRLSHEAVLQQWRLKTFLAQELIEEVIDGAGFNVLHIVLR